MPFSRQSLFICCFFLSNFSFGVIYSQAAENNSSITNENQQCPISTFEKIAQNEQALGNNTIKIISQYSSIEKNQFAHFSGGVTLINKTQRITANELAFNRLSSAINASGAIHYQNNGINIHASDLVVSEQDRSTQMNNASYQFSGIPGHGNAGKLQISADGGLSLVDSTFTTCVGDAPDWQLKASEIIISAEGDVGEAYNAQFRVFDVPVLYIPYFSFPVSNQRKTGFLYPTMSTSNKSGLEIETPFYWNISENMDATLTPHYMSKRGVQLITEFRYLSDLQSGVIDLEYLNKDNELQDNNDPRYLARIQHVGTFSENFRVYVDYTTISDDNYLVDIESNQYSSNDAYLYQIGELSYFGENWQATMKLQDFEVLGDHQQSYKTTPHIEVHVNQPLSFWQGQFEVYSELSHFQAADDSQPEANRYHVEAGLTFPISTPAWFFNSEFKLMQTYYQQENIEGYSDLEKNVSRTLPKVRFHGGINFDRKLAWFDGYRQTLEPQLQYLYIPEEDQSNIGLYDTTNLQDDYNGLFRDRRYSGLDRISAANQYTWGVTSRILDASNLEIFRLSLGRITYLDKDYLNQESNIVSNPLNNDLVDSINNGSNNNLSNDLTTNEFSNDQSSLAADLFYRLNHQWQISGGLQYNTHESFTNKSQVNLDYQFDKYHTVQLSHRYTRNVSGESLEQASLLTSFAINKDWAFVGRMTRDLQQGRSLETYAGFQYESCCWAIRFAYHRHINSNLDDDSLTTENRDEFNSGFMVQFIIKGLGGQQSAIGIQDMFDSSIFGYKRPYILNN